MVGEPLPPGAEVLIPAAAMREGFDRLAARLQPLVDSGDCVLLIVMNGGLYPAAQLLQRLSGDYLLEYCHATRYGNALTGGGLTWERGIPASVKGRRVLLVDDIFDAGITLAAVADACRAAGAADVRTVIQVVKERPRDPAVGQPDFTTGLTVPDVYVFGCGMDMQGRWRHLPAIYGLTGASGL